MHPQPHSQIGSTHLLGSMLRELPWVHPKYQSALWADKEQAPAKQLSQRLHHSHSQFSAYTAPFSVGCVWKKKTSPAYVRVYTITKAKSGVCKHIWSQHFLTSTSSGFHNCLVHEYIQYIHMHTNIYLVCMLRIWNCVYENGVMLSLPFFFCLFSSCFGHLLFTRFLLF